MWRLLLMCSDWFVELVILCVSSGIQWQRDRERERERERERGGRERRRRKREEVLQTAVSCDHEVHLLGFAFLHFDWLWFDGSGSSSFDLYWRQLLLDLAGNHWWALGVTEGLTRITQSLHLYRKQETGSILEQNLTNTGSQKTYENNCFKWFHWIIRWRVNTWEGNIWLSHMVILESCVPFL